ncbi:MAG: hypothetical protein H0X02_09455 [Nitrosomonas sp.]|nr:hypothetical protein [Nitrosomonas sp.]
MNTRRICPNKSGFVQVGKGQPSPWQQSKILIFLGDDDFFNDMQCKLNPAQSLKGMPKKQAPAKPLSYFDERYKTHDESMAQAYWSEHYALAQMGEFWG